MIPCVGLIGNIASGKSTVAKLFAQHGIETLSADDVAKKLTAKHQPALDAIIKHFGVDIITEDGELDRKALRGLMTHDVNARLWLEQYLHPLIRTSIEEALLKVQSPYALIEIPLLKDKKDYPYIQRILLITAHHEQKIQRLTLRDNTSLNDAKALLSIQMDDEVRRQIADDVCVNNGSLKALEEKVAHLHQNYLTCFA